jgi:RNA polymerase sigma factor (sigma-70 family)
MSNSTLLVAWQQRWNRNLRRFLGRRVRSAVDVEDLAQETYLRLLRAPDLSQVRNPEAYVLRVANHVALEWRDHQRRTGSTVALEEDSLVDNCVPEFEIDADLSQARLEQALMTASPMMRAALLLKLRDKCSCEEIAADLEITPRQVKRYLERGYERLRQALES